MAGFFDFLGDPSQAALWAAGTGLLDARQGQMGRALMGAMPAFAEADQNKRRNELVDLQIAQHKQAMAQAAQQQAMQQAFLGRFLGGGGAQPQGARPAPSVGPMDAQSAATPAGQMRLGNIAAAQQQAQAPQQGSPQGGFPMSLNETMAAKIIGLPDVFEGYKFANTPQERKQGNFYKNPITGQMEFTPEIRSSANGETSVVNIGADGKPVVSLPDGALQTRQAYQDLANRNDFVEWTDPNTGQKMRGTKAQQLSALGVGPPPGQVPPNVSAPRGGRPNLDIPQGMPADGVRNVADLRRLIEQDPTLPKAQAPAGVPVGPTAATESTFKNREQFNQEFIKTTLPAVNAANNAASNMLTSIGVARKALPVSGSGWGTEGKAAFGNVLKGFGIAPEGISNATTAAQIFEQASSTRLWEVLNNAKGPQTEGDATRAKKTMASLSNTQEANGFILDLLQAQAERDQMKAKFFNGSIDVAQKQGHPLNQIETEWNKRMPSVFDMPSMKKWGAK